MLREIFHIYVVNNKVVTSIDKLEIVKGGRDTISIINQDSLENLSVNTTDANVATATFNGENGLIIVTSVSIGKTNLTISTSNSDSKIVLITVTEATTKIVLESENEIVMKRGTGNTDLKATNYLELKNLTASIENRSRALIWDHTDGVFRIYSYLPGETIVRLKADGAVIVEIKLKIVDNIKINDTSPIALEIAETKNLNISLYKFLGEITVSSSDEEIVKVVYNEGLLTVQGFALGSAIITVEATYGIQPIEIAVTVGEIEILINVTEITIRNYIIDKTSLTIKNQKHLKNLTVTNANEEMEVELNSDEIWISPDTVGTYKVTFSADNAADVTVAINVVEQIT